jgi:trans-AT polyketide synthase/acyltransferase/oxidoreductase domain-containing protein
MRAILFAGQGSQCIGMGSELFDAYPQHVETASELLGYSIRELCEHGPLERLTRTEYTQPAVYVVNALAYLKWRGENPAPIAAAGHSVGEYNALLAAGVVDFETGLRLVARRGALMAEASGGAMAAVIGLDAEQVEAVLRTPEFEQVYAANFNAPKQIVISGPSEAVTGGEAAFLAAGASRYVLLNVSAAFHTPLMAAARDAFATFAETVTWKPPTLPVISNVSARPLQPGQEKATMVAQLTSPVRWCEGIRYLLAKGVALADFEEIIDPPRRPLLKAMVAQIKRDAGPLEPSALGEEGEAFKHVSSRESGGRRSLTAQQLGSREFCDRFGVRLPVVAGGMYRGIASTALVIRMANAGLLSFFGAAGLSVEVVEEAIRTIAAAVRPGAAFGVNFIAHATRPELEEQLTDALLRHGVRIIEASAFMEVTPALVRYRAKGLARGSGGAIVRGNRIIAKVSRPDVAAQFLAPAPERMVRKLVEAGALSAEEARLLAEVPIADAICVESDSGGHTDQGTPLALIPSISSLRDRVCAAHPEWGPIHVGAGGGIGTPQAAAAAFVLGVDFILTGSINQCTVEAGTSDLVKDMLEGMDVQDTDYTPSGAMFEMGSLIQVLRKGTFFPARANKLVSLYRQHGSLEEIDAGTRRQIQDRYLKRSFEQAYEEVCRTHSESEIARANRVPKHRMALIFKRYYGYSSAWALAGEAEHKVDFQIHCGPALGAFNQWVRGSSLEPWRNRHVDVLAIRLLEGAAEELERRVQRMYSLQPVGR